MIFTEPAQFVPPMSEIYHYPFLCVGWFGLFITAMNMIPVGQLDGGHIIYSMCGFEKHFQIAKISMAVFDYFGVFRRFRNIISWQDRIRLDRVVALGNNTFPCHQNETPSRFDISRAGF